MARGARRATHELATECAPEEAGGDDREPEDDQRQRLSEHERDADQRDDDADPQHLPPADRSASWPIQVELAIPIR